MKSIQIDSGFKLQCLFWIVPLWGILILKVKQGFRMDETKLKQGSSDLIGGCAHWSYLELDSSIILFMLIGSVKSCYLYK